MHIPYINLMQMDFYKLKLYHFFFLPECKVAIRQTSLI